MSDAPQESNVNRDVAEFDLGNKGRLVITGQRAMYLGLTPEEIADRYVAMVEQGCPMAHARRWAQGSERG